MPLTTPLERYEINKDEILSVWETNINFVVRLDNITTNASWILLKSNDKDEALRFFELTKEAYEELIY